MQLAVGDTRSAYDQLSAVYLPVMLGVFVLVVGVIVVFAVRYRAHEDDPKRFSRRREGAARVEFAFIVLLAGVAVTLSVLTLGVGGREDARTAHPDLRIHAVAAKWRWRFEYPGGVSQSGENDRAATLVVPRGETVAFSLDAVDVIHAMWVPDLRFKKDAIPGRTNNFDLVFTTPGYFAGMGECSELCGTFHAQMRFNVRVMEPGAFRAWLSRRREQGT